ncbi:hypothetical protein NGM33_13955 [Nocardiopsis dassonvillei]|uniref:hypothetical protein n=1 Tax=Nocardiopsis dassonvillei TaxID=2014 RepID=UPI0020A267D9|nr:hypothetical protein [Nocardiopsis dassonvillei]MCP3014438.1 hypothetical protein [Nocardiopsis dassonvillei]
MEFRAPGSEVFGSVADHGRYFTLQILDPEDESAPPRMVVLDTATGEPVQDYSLTEGDSSSGVVRGWLGNVTDEHWITVDGDGGGLTAFELGSDRTAWSVPDPARCEDVGSVDALVTLDEVTVAAGHLLRTAGGRGLGGDDRVAGVRVGFCGDRFGDGRGAVANGGTDGDVPR